MARETKSQRIVADPHRKGAEPFEMHTIGASRFDSEDPYHAALTVSWPAFLGLMACAYLLTGLVFAVLYGLSVGAIANVRPGHIEDLFFFSIETLATVGYGDMHPQTTYGHQIATLEILVGIVFTAVLTGLIFVRFSKPRAKVIYADRIVITPYNGCRTLMIRIGNGRTNFLSDANLRLSVLIREVSHEGRIFRRVHELTLLRSHNPVFAINMTLMHPIDDKSPLQGFTNEGLASSDMRLFLSFQARDPALGAMVHDLRTYSADAIWPGFHYADMVTFDADGRTVGDLRQISTLEPDELFHA
jgi:inward rectifier potassium channel